MFRKCLAWLLRSGQVGWWSGQQRAAATQDMLKPFSCFKKVHILCFPYSTLAIVTLLFESDYYMVLYANEGQAYVLASCKFCRHTSLSSTTNNSCNRARKQMYHSHWKNVCADDFSRLLVLYCCSCLATGGLDCSLFCGVGPNSSQ